MKVISLFPWHTAKRLLEFLALFAGIPLALYLHTTRWDAHVCLWIASIYTLCVLRRENLSWRELWHGNGWSPSGRRAAVGRFVFATIVIFLFTYYLVPNKFLSFPLQRPLLWLIVMIFYPVLSALPQEMVFRSFIFHRYRPLFVNDAAMILVSALSFAAVHIIFRNYISPTLCFAGGWIFAYGYTQHRSLKWAALEHAAYGCMVFTAGIGRYFLVGGLAH